MKNFYCQTYGFFPGHFSALQQSRLGRRMVVERGEELPASDWPRINRRLIVVHVPPPPLLPFSIFTDPKCVTQSSLFVAIDEREASPPHIRILCDNCSAGRISINLQGSSCILKTHRNTFMMVDKLREGIWWVKEVGLSSDMCCRW